ncbi:serine/threonine-protein kinase [Acidobacteriota bacterium]
MTDAKHPGSDDPTIDARGGADRKIQKDEESSLAYRIPKFEAKSIVTKLAPTGETCSGGGLRKLVDETSVPEIHTGQDKYQVLKPLGQGGMGSVHLVCDRDLKRNVALKMIIGGNGTRQARFLEEAQVMGQLQHPNILPVHELGLAEENKLYYTMPEVRGQTLQTILDGLAAGDGETKKKYSLTRLIQIFIQVAQAMSYAHDKGVVHRDIKPSNIMVGEHGEVQVIDWGLSKVVVEKDLKIESGGPLTETGVVVGTPYYMAPEQASGEEVDARTDIYALGVLLYEMLTLERPFEGSQIEVLAASLREKESPLPGSPTGTGASMPKGPQQDS